MLIRIHFHRLPEWTKKVYPGGDMKWISGQSFVTNTATPVLKRLKAGFLLREILTRLTNKTLSKLTPDRTLHMYSAHDTTVASLLNTLGVFDVSKSTRKVGILLQT